MPQSPHLAAWKAFCRAVEAEIMRHGFPSFDAGHEAGLWDGLPWTLCLPDVDLTDPLTAAREIMWWHDGTVLALA